MLKTRPLTRADASTLVTLFGKNGACGGCWCMFWHLPRKDFDAGKAGANRDLLAERVADGRTSGVLAFDGDTAVGWAAVGPRLGFARVVAHKNLQRGAGPEVWSIPCFYVPAAQRRRGVAAALLDAAVAYAFAQGATEVEGYPVRPKPNGTLPAAFAYTGTDGMFAKAGFTLVPREGRELWVRAR